MAACEGCGTVLPPAKQNANRARRWCSDRCRKRHLYGVVCVDCGFVTNGSERRHANYRCRSCRVEHGYRERRGRVAELWGRGATMAEIADTLGLPCTVVSDDVRRLQKRGVIGRRLVDRRSRWPAIQELWRQGLTAPEIGERLGITQGNVGVQVQSMRWVGWDVPYRRPSRRAA